MPKALQAALSPNDQNTPAKSTQLLAKLGCLQETGSDIGLWLLPRFSGGLARREVKPMHYFAARTQ
jgi:hypothetical protein